MPPAIPTRVAIRPPQLAMLLAGLGLGGLALLYAFDPSSHGFYPRCWLHSLTGLQCPGCGGLRAAHCLLHGRLGDAFRFNPLFVCLLPVAACFAVDRLIRFRNRDDERLPGRGPLWFWLFAGITLAFGVVRNLI